MSDARSWLPVRHTLRAETLVVVALYALYEAGRGLVAGDRATAVAHARSVASFERTLHVFLEPHVQQAARSVPGLVGVLGLAYLTLHLSVTAGLLLWLHRRRPASFAFVRTTLLVASALALIGFIAFPTAPPRLAGLGIADTVSGRHVDLNKGLVSSLYNPFAAVPSLHMGYSLVVGGAIFTYARNRIAKAVGAAYPALVLFMIVATGQHFLFDAAAGAALVAIAAVVSWQLTRTRPGVEVTERFERIAQAPPCELAPETVASHSARVVEVGDAWTIVTRALIVDDNEQFLASAQRVLEAGDVVVVAVASGGAEAIRLARELRPEIALVDVDLGEESGFDLAESLAALDAAPVVVLVSTHAEHELGELVASSSAAGFLPKSQLDASAVRAFLD
jgi:CheY-like chemotaxis protein